MVSELKKTIKTIEQKAELYAERQRPALSCFFNVHQSIRMATSIWRITARINLATIILLCVMGALLVPKLQRTYYFQLGSKGIYQINPAKSAQDAYNLTRKRQSNKKMTEKQRGSSGS